MTETISVSKTAELEINTSTFEILSYIIQGKRIEAIKSHRRYHYIHNKGKVDLIHSRDYVDSIMDFPKSTIEEAQQNFTLKYPELML